MPRKKKIKPKMRSAKKARAKKKLPAKAKQGNSKKKQKAVKRKKALGKGVKEVMEEQTEMNLERADETQVDPGPVPLSQEETEEVGESPLSYDTREANEDSLAESRELAEEQDEANGEADEDDFE